MKKNVFFVSVVSLVLLSCWKNPIDVTKTTAAEDNGISVAADGSIQLPGRIEAEAYKAGGEGAGYHDLTSGNTGGSNRTDNVDLQACTDASGGYNVGWIDAGEWLAYDISIATAGAFTFTMRMASANSGTKTATVTIDGSTVATFNFTDATGWQSWRNVTVSNVNISSGNHELRIVMKTGGFNLNYFDITAQGNQIPVANAGVNQTTNVRSLVTLDGRGSSDPDRLPSPLTYAWTQVSGTTVSLTGASTAQPTFTPTVTGSFSFRLTVGDGVATSTDEVVVTAGNGTVISLPGRIEAEVYNTGGEGTGYHDLTSGNTGMTYRTDNVDIETCTDASGGFNVGWIDAGEWLAYNVNVTQTGAYTFTMRMASANSGAKTATVSIDGSTVATINFTDASGWQSWKNVIVSNINMTTGNHVLRVAMTTGGFNFNYLEITAQGNQPPVANAGADQTVNVNSPVTFDGRGSIDPDRGPSLLTYSWSQIGGATVLLTGATAAQPTFTPTATGNYTFRLTVNDGAATSTDDIAITVRNGTFISLPCRIEAEAYKTGGEGTGFHDLTSGNTGASYRTDNVDIESNTDAGGGYNVGWIDAGEWLAYDVNVTQSGAYTLIMRMASANSGTKTATVTVDGSTVATLNFTDASGWQSWKNVNVGYVNLTAGNHNLRIVMTTGGFNLNYLDINLQGANQPPVANAGPDQVVKVNTLMTLDGRGSSDPDNGPSSLRYNWTQISGSTVNLSGATTAQPTFTVTAAGTYTFRLTVTDGIASSSDDITCGDRTWDFYLANGGDARNDYNQLVAAGNTADAALMARIAFTPTARWFGDWDPISAIESRVDGLLDAAAAQGRIAMFVVYAIYAKDCGSYSAGGLSPDQYIAWVTAAARGIQGRHPWVVLEPDALAMLGSCEMGDRVGLLRQAAQLLTQAGARVYIDIGNSGWLSVNDRINRLNQVGTQYIYGFASNVSNYELSSNERSAGDAIAAATGLHYIIDSGRNGNGSNGEWCNPRGRALGEYPRIVNSGALDAYVWVKGPGGSDGPCNGGPAAGVWFHDLAIELCRNAAANGL